ncbi:cysteine-type endopeptidase [Coprinopsis cinerea okayama7|uniref:separase n=1 Tax=Coprinopsis cinerea (strain Okayama-7 / 130 / ATCC MYA-4618 / FGSC 9003) TaxID=240176 RepID=A8NBE9_COPC7|nr:cysteine-type endopeptidase [Coprinopsis cinerea okayama7\|eukprot:XP_001832147.1 cysteine-type endopeptidase [Coprinopsis cinerea okayama7\
MFILRSYALHALSCTSPGVVEPAMFWEQVMRFVNAYVSGISKGRPTKSSSEDEQANREEEEATNSILRFFDSILEAVQEREDAGSWTTDPSSSRPSSPSNGSKAVTDTRRGAEKFALVCEMWIGFARKVGDVGLLERVGALMGGGGGDTSSSSAVLRRAAASVFAARAPSGFSTPKQKARSLTPAAATEEEGREEEAGEEGSVEKEKERQQLTLKEVMHHATKICAVFAQGVVALDNVVGACSVNGGTSDEDDKETIRNLQPSLQILQTSLPLHYLLRGEVYTPFVESNTDDPRLLKEIEDFKRLSGKVDRGFERLRRACVTIIEPARGGKTLRKLAEEILESCVGVLKGLVVLDDGEIHEDEHATDPELHHQVHLDFISDVLSRALNTLFLLARTTLDTRDMESCIPAYDYLEEGVGICDGVVRHESRRSSPQSQGGGEDGNEVGRSKQQLDIPNYLRCISGAFYNLAGRLYQAQRFGAAVPFLKRACVVGEKGLEGWRERKGRLGAKEEEQKASGRSVKGRKEGLGIGAVRGGVRAKAKEEESKEGKEESEKERKEREKEREWRLLENQLFKRYELLAVCYLKNGDRKNSYEAFKDCIRVFPFSSTRMAERADRVALDGVFDPDSAVPAPTTLTIAEDDENRAGRDDSDKGDEKNLLQQLKNLLDRVTYVGACELLLSAREVSVRSGFGEAVAPSGSEDDLVKRMGGMKLDGVSASPSSDAGSLRKPDLKDIKIIGALLEYQYEALLQNRHKEGARRVLVGLLKDMVEVYSVQGPFSSPGANEAQEATPARSTRSAVARRGRGGRVGSGSGTGGGRGRGGDKDKEGEMTEGYLMPVRRARALLKCLEFLYRDQGPDSSDGTSSPANDLLVSLNLSSTTSLADEILKMLSLSYQQARLNVGEDVALAIYTKQYRISTHLWVALHAHKRGNGNGEMLGVVATHVAKGARILKFLFDSFTGAAGGGMVLGGRRSSVRSGGGVGGTPIRRKVSASPRVVKARSGSGGVGRKASASGGKGVGEVVVKRVVEPRATRSRREPPSVPAAPRKPPASSRTRVGTRAGTRSATAAGATVAVGTGVGSSSAAPPITPKATKTVTLLSPVSSVGTPPRPSLSKEVASVGVMPIPFDDFGRFHELLMLTVRILGLLSLVLPRVQLLASLRRLCQRQLGAASEGVQFGIIMFVPWTDWFLVGAAFIVCSLELAYEYVQLGKLKRATTIFGTALDVVRAGDASEEISAFYLLRFAEALAMAGEVEKSAKVYLEALEHAQRIEPDHRGMSSVQRIHTRTRKLELSAMAAYVYALVQFAREDVTTSLNAMLQSLRLWNRAIDAISRLSKSSKSQASSNPFESNETPTNTSAHPMDTTQTASKSKTILASSTPTNRRGTGAGEFEWRIFQGLLSSLFALADAYLTRGSPRESEYFLKQAKELGEELNLGVVVGRAMTRLSEVLLGMGKLESAQESLEEAARRLGIRRDGEEDFSEGDVVEVVDQAEDDDGFEEVEVNKGPVVAALERIENKRLLAKFNEKAELNEDAQELLFASMRLLDELNGRFQKVDSSFLGIRKSLDNENSGDVVVPDLLALVLCRSIWLLRENMDADFHALVDKLESLPMSMRTKVEENALMANLTLYNVYNRFRSDMFLSSLTESTISIPMGMSSQGGVQIALPVQDVLNALDTAEKYFQEGLKLSVGSGDVLKAREAAVSLTLVKVFQTSLGRLGDTNAVYASSLLDTSSAITLRREMLEAIHQKIAALRSDDIEWPMMDSKGAPQAQVAKPTRRIFDDSDVDMDDSDDEGEVSVKKYWENVKSRYEPRLLDPEMLSTSRTADLPSNWTIVHVSLTDDKGTLLVSRQECGESGVEPLVFSVPLKGRRDNGGGEDEEHLTFEDAMQEFNDIIRLSDEGTKSAIHVRSDDEEARSNWWRQRNELDVRLKDLLENIEFCWLGAFKTILGPRPDLTPELLSELRAGIDRVFQRSLHVKDPKRTTKSRSTGHRRGFSQSLAPSQVTLDDTMLRCFSTLSPKCRDEELEDLLYFVLDLYQLHGVPIAIAEVDALQVVVDLRAVLEEHNARLMKHRRTNRAMTAALDEHVFLVLDKNVQGLPWESLPIMKGRSISRIPCVDFLVDRVELANLKRGKSRAASASTTGGPPGSAVLDTRKGYFILNPSGDLGKTEGRFKEWTDDMKQIGWDGVVGRAVSEQQFVDALRTKDFVVYFGHGGGEQYVRSHRIRSLPTCAATMLWGCSSGALREMGDFDRVGTPYNYMLAGCPTLVANLWDVTDRDIDKFSMSVFDKVGLKASEIKKRGDKQQQSMSVVAAVAQSRDVCKLKYLTGAAPVVYGIPFYL